MMKLRLCVQNNSKHSKSNSEHKLANVHVNHLVETVTESNDLSNINFYSKT